MMLFRVAGTYFAVGKEQSNTFDANLKKSAFSGSQVLNGEFTSELHTRKSSSTSRSRSFHRFFYAVVQRFALLAPHINIFQFIHLYIHRIHYRIC